MSFKRVIILVIDACGVGELPDAADYGDVGAATLPNLARSVGGLKMPNCRDLGLGNIVAIEGVSSVLTPKAFFGKMAEVSPGKDSTSGHWEIGGVQLDSPFPLFPDGFPRGLVERFEKAVGLKTIGNVAASGTEIIDRLGAHHLETGDIILYTSADSVFQLAAHEKLFPLERQYEICRVARSLLAGELAVGRVIARPFMGEPGNFQRTSGRRDFSLVPPKDTILDLMSEAGFPTLSIGKIFDLFAGRGITTSIKTTSNREGLDQLIRALKNDSEHALIFANLVDFDQLWGHRNDEANFAQALEEFDRHLGELVTALREEDLLIITADHGCDPTIKSSTDHSREYVPLLVYSHSIGRGNNLGTRQTFADIAKTIANNFSLKEKLPGTSFLNDLTGDER